MAAEIAIWIARDSDGSLAMYQTQPTYNETMGVWEPTGDDPTVEFVELGPMKWPEIEPACCVKFEQKIHYRETFVCPSCHGTGTVYVDFEHPQWVTCGCVNMSGRHDSEKTKAKCITISHSAEGIRMQVESGSWLMWSNQVQLAESFAHKHDECEELRGRLNSAIGTLCSVAKIAEKHDPLSGGDKLAEALSRVHALASPSIPF